MLRSYIDESEQKKEPSIYAVGSVIMPLETALVVEREWRDALATEKISVFHAVELAHFQGEFFGWEEGRRRRFSSALMDIVRRALGGGFKNKSSTWGGVMYTAAISRAAFDELSFDQKQVLTEMHWPALQNCLVASAHFAQTRGDQVEIIAEGCDRLTKDVGDFYRNVRANTDNPKFHMRGLAAGLGKHFASFSAISKTSSDARALLLQIADWIAYEVGKELRERLSGDSRHPKRWPMNQFEAMPGFFVEFYESANAIIRQMPPHLK